MTSSSRENLKLKYGKKIPKGTKSEFDYYGFQRDADFDFLQFEEFQSAYLAVLARRDKRWNQFNAENYENILKMGKPKLKRFCRKGIPSSFRAKVWLEVSGALLKMNRNVGVYSNLVSKECGNAADAEMLAQISIDLQRTFPDNKHFNNNTDNDLKKSLERVLKAFGLHHREIGYCQGINYVAALLLLIVKEEEKCFWLLHVLVSDILPPYYNSAMSGSRAEMEVLTELITERYPEVQQKMEEEHIPWTLITSKWFICLYVDVLPIETVLRVWDCLFFEGSKVLLRTALHIVNLKRPHLKVCSGMQETIEAFKNLKGNKDCLECHTFMQQCFKETNPLPMRRIRVLRMKYLAVVLAEDAEVEEKRRRLKNM